MPDRVMPPPLELATFVADDVVLADANAWKDGRLHLDLGSLAGAVVDGALASVQIEVVRPGDPVRIANVLDAVLPDVKADEPDQTFPGALGARRSRAAAAPTAWRAWVCCPSAIGWPRGTRNRRSSPTRSSTWRVRERR